MNSENKYCSICLEEIINKNQEYKSEHCNCEMIYHLKCWNEYYNNEYKCPICKIINYDDLFKNVIYREYEKIHYSYLKLINNNCSCKINNIYLSDEIYIIVYERNKIICMYNELYYFDNNILEELINYIDNNKKNKNYKFSLLNIIKKAIKYIINMNDNLDEY